MANKSMWTGSISLGLLNVPVSIAKAWSEEKEKSIRDLCECCKRPVDRSERCSFTGKAPTGKVKGVDMGDGTYRVLAPNEFNAIEETTKSGTLDVLDAQPRGILPMNFATGAYYLRADKNVKGSEHSFKYLCDGLEKTGFALVVKWCNSSKQKLCLIYATNGIIMMNTVPMAIELRLPGDEEKRHQSVTTDTTQAELMVKLLNEIKQETFDYKAIEDEGLKLRRAAVDKVLDGERLEIPQEEIEAPPVDLMSVLQASIKEVSHA